MQIDMNQNRITWITSDGRQDYALLTKKFQNLTLTPYFEMQIDNDSVLFVE